MLVPVLFALVSLVEGENCPAPVDVEARVRAILHLSPEQQLSEGFVIERHEAGLYVALRSADSTLIGERTLPTAGSCDELAQAAAVVLTAWLTNVHPDFAGALPPSVGEAEPEPAPEPEPEPAPEPVPAPKPAPPAKIVAPPVAPPTPAPSSHPWQVALAVGGDLTSDALAPAAFVGVSYGADPSGLALGARAIVSLSRDEPLGTGQVSWRRWPLGLGPTLRLENRSFAVAFSAGPALAWLHLLGDSFDRTSAKDGVQWGGFLEVMASGKGRPLTAFALLNAQIYPIKASAYVSGRDRDLEWELPVLSTTLAVGARFSP